MSGSRPHKTEALPPAFERALEGGRGWGITWADGLVIAATLLATVALCCVLWFGYGVHGIPGLTASAAGEGEKAPVAVVQSSDGFYQVLPLDHDATVVVEGPLGTNVIEVAGGRVRCVESDCGNQVCVNSGWVSFPGEMIVCLPHRLTVQVVEDPQDAAPLV